jgi:hypothetical protein
VDLDALTGQVMDPDLREWTRANSADVRHETTDLVTSSGVSDSVRRDLGVFSSLSTSRVRRPEEASRSLTRLMPCVTSSVSALQSSADQCRPRNLTAAHPVRSRGRIMPYWIKAAHNTSHREAS